MVSFQVLARADEVRGSGRQALLLRTAACGLALLLASGCSLFPAHETPAAAAPAPRVAHSTAPVATQQTSLEAALARGDNVPASPGTAMAAANAPAASTTVVLNPNAPKSYTVKRGDTLWGISAMFLRDPWLWPEIWYVNPAIQNPHLIYPGDVLTLAYGADGSPQIHLERGAAGLSAATRVEPLARSTPIDGPIATIPYAAIASFLGKPSLITTEQARRAPHVVALRDLHVAVGAPHTVYVSGLQKAAAGRYSVVRLGDALKDPKTGKLLGYMGIYTGTARVEEPAKVSRAVLTESTRETQPGDLLFPEEQATSADLLPHAAPDRLDGQILSVLDGVSMIGQYQVVAINRGTRQGLEAGHVLAIDQAGEVVHDKSCLQRAQSWCFGGGPKVALPSERAGTLLVFKTYQDVSFGLTVMVTAPVRVADHVRTP